MRAPFRRVQHELPALGRIGKPGMIVKIVRLFGKAPSVELDGFVVAPDMAQSEGRLGAHRGGKSESIEFRGFFFDGVKESEDVLPAVFRAKNVEFAENPASLTAQTFFFHSQFRESGEEVRCWRVVVPLWKSFCVDPG
jgi:hypothetical protein